MILRGCRFNRTFMELKFAQTAFYQYTATVLIAPLWN